MFGEEIHSMNQAAHIASAAEMRLPSPRRAEMRAEKRKANHQEHKGHEDTKKIRQAICYPILLFVFFVFFVVNSISG